MCGFTGINIASCAVDCNGVRADNGHCSVVALPPGDVSRRTLRVRQPRGGAGREDGTGRPCALHVLGRHAPLTPCVQQRTQSCQ
jgi:hypothetical protein